MASFDLTLVICVSVDDSKFSTGGFKSAHKNLISFKKRKKNLLWIGSMIQTNDKHGLQSMMTLWRISVEPAIQIVIQHLSWRYK